MGQNLSGKKAVTRSAAPRALSSIILAAFLVSFALAGCSKKSVRAERPLPEYSSVLDSQTRSTKIYSGLDTVLFITATYKTMEFREAYVELFVKGFEEDPAYRSALVSKQRDENDLYNEIFFAAYTSEPKFNDFERRDSVWKLYLDDNEGNRLTPVSVKKVDSADPLIRKLFPYLDPWSSGYIVRFPKYSVTGTEPIPGPKTKFLKFVVTGLMGKGEMEWEFND